MVVFGGDQVIADNYNRLLYADGKGLLPAALGPSVGDAAKKEAAFVFNPLGYRHPIVAEFQGAVRPGHGRADPGADLAVPQADAPRGLERPGRAGLRQRRSRGDRGAAAPRHGDPGGHVGRHGLDDLAAAQELPADHAADRPPGRGRAGSPSGTSGSASPRPVVAGGRRLGGRHGGALPRAAGGRPAERQPAASASSTSSRPSCPGKYQVKIGPPLTVEIAFAANPDPAESDLAKLDRARWTKDFRAGTSSI